jgi:ABC-type glycerol-3-phosphate transport system substrate-binding protein
VLTRRDLLRGAAVTLGVGGLASAAGARTLPGCAGGRTQVAVVWTGHELAMFRRVLDDYRESVEVISAGDDIDALIRARQRSGTSPDVAILTRPGLIRGYVDRGWLAPMRSPIVARGSARWNQLLRFGADRHLYGAWVKAAQKSLFWYRPSLLDRDPPDTWDALVAYVVDQAAGPGPAPLAIGAADGWVATDWLDNLIAAIVPVGIEDDLARGEPRWGERPVREAFEQLARVWSVPGAFPGGGRRALLTQFDASVIQVTEGEAVMTCEADFVAGFADRFPPNDGDGGDDGDIEWFPFPAVDREPPVVVGGDAAVVLHDSPAGHELVEWLTRAGSFRPWLDEGGYMTPNLSVTLGDYPPGDVRRLAEDVRSDDVRFDLSDRLPGSASGRDGGGSWLVLQDFFSDVARPHPDVGAAIDRAVGRLDEAVVAAREDQADG